MAIETQTNLVGEIHCMNCGRTLATVARDATRGSLRLRPARHQSVVQVIVAGRHVLRCKHCQGRAFLEPLAEPSVELESSLALSRS